MEGFTVFWSIFGTISQKIFVKLVSRQIPVQVISFQTAPRLNPCAVRARCSHLSLPGSNFAWKILWTFSFSLNTFWRPIPSGLVLYWIHLLLKGFHKFLPSLPSSFGLSFEDQSGRSLALSASQTKTKSFVDETALTFKPLPSLPLTQKAEGFPYCISVSLGLTKKIYNVNAHWTEVAPICKWSKMVWGRN